MSVPTRRTVCATCRQKPCACVTDADRIATLTAELAEAREFGATEQKTRMELFYQLDAVRADHERSKARVQELEALIRGRK